MNSKNVISLKIEEMHKIIKGLNEISLLCSEPHIKMKIEGVQKFVSGFLDSGSKISVEDKIFEKMVEVKQVNPDLHLKLYILYRNLVSGRISGVDAIASYESCLKLFVFDEMVY
ncbi:hypothetical protein [Clostridium sp.]